MNRSSRKARRRMLPMAAIALAMALGGVPDPALAHVAPGDQIAALTARIRREPGRADLYLRRGELKRASRLWQAAAADYGRARRLDPGMAAVDLSFALLWLDKGEPGRAIVPLDRFLGRHPDHIGALAARGRALDRLGRGLEAAGEFTRAIVLSRGAGSGLPDYYLERAAALARAGDGQVAEAIRGLDEGIAVLGPVVTLVRSAIDLEIRRGAWDEALGRLDRAVAGAARRESWLARRGRILERAGRPEQARVAYDEARKAIEALPPRHRSTRMMSELSSEVREALARLSGVVPDRGAGR